MKIFIFSGPTLSPEQGRNYLDAVYLGPACQGDVYAASREKPWGIGIIDGYFERVPAIWHKEILWAMSQGIHVFGSASMGALRAAELADFGMQGVGKIFEAFYQGELEHDDEVVLMHGPAEAGYLRASEPLVNIRYTLAAAESQDIITPGLHEELVKTAQNLHYPQRSYSKILTEVAKSGVDARQLDILRHWLDNHRVDQKHDDAIQMLKLMQEQLQTNPDPKQVDYRFQHTDAWETLRRSVDQRPLDRHSATETFAHDAVLEEFRIQLSDYRFELESALVRALALEIARYRQLEVGESLLQQSFDAFRVRNDIAEPGAVDGWLQQNGLDWDRFAALMGNEARVYRIRMLAEPDLDTSLCEQLRVSGRYHHLYQRAVTKQRLLDEYGLENPGLKQAGLSEQQLWSWFFHEHLGIKIPANLEEYAQAHDFKNLNEFRRAVLREHCFLRLAETHEPQSSLV